MRKNTGVLFKFAATFLFLAITVMSAAATNSSAKKDDRLLKGVGNAMGSLSRTATGPAESPAGGIGTFVETMVILTLFVAGVYFLFRFIQKKKGTSISGETAIKLLSSRSVGGNRMLQIVEVGNQVFFIGVGDGAVNLISEISDRETIDWLKMEYSKGPATGSTGFLEKLSSLVGKGGASAATGDTSADNDNAKMDYLKKQRERLKKMQNGGDE